MSEASAPDAREVRVTFCVAFAAFVFQFEAFLVNVSLPTIARDFGATTTSASFVVIAYLLAATIAFVPSGRLGEQFGLARVFLAGCSLALLGTLLSSAAPSLWMLWLGRFIQGLGAGAMVALGYAMIPAWLRSDRVGWGYGYLSTGAGLGMIAGLPAGGLVSHLLDWRWVFLCTIPLFGLLLIYAWKVLPGPASRPAVTGRFDGTGTLMFAVLLGALVITLSLGSELGWGSPWILSAAVIAAAMAVAILLRAKYRGRFYLPVAALHTRSFSIGLVVMLMVELALSGIRFLMPFYLELSCGLSALAASVMLLIYPLSFAPTARWAGQKADHVGSRPLLLIAGLVGIAGTALFSLTLPMLNLWATGLFLLLLGLATGLFFAPNNRYAMSSLTPALRSEAGALLPVALNIGTILGISLFDTVFSLHLPGGVAVVQELTQGNMHTLIKPATSEGFGTAVMLASGILALATCIVGAAYRDAPARPARDQPM